MSVISESNIKLIITNVLVNIMSNLSEKQIKMLIAKNNYKNELLQIELEHREEKVERI